MESRVITRSENSERIDDTPIIFAKRYKEHMEAISSIIGAFEGKVIDVRAAFLSNRNNYSPLARSTAKGILTRFTKNSRETLR